jgi:hypothetical protein
MPASMALTFSSQCSRRPSVQTLPQVTKVLTALSARSNPRLTW